jgi:hypothetical protein
MSRSLAVFILAGFIIGATVTGPGCANVIPPQGGPRDSLAPLLLRATPPDSSRNFTGNRISFVFDEFVDIQNIQQSLIISPTPGLTPTVDFRLNTVTVRLREPLESNTTYTFNFGDAIRDVNEGNIAKELTYIFSTGPYLDSLELRGKVVLAETGKIDTTLLAILHTNPSDSAVVKEKPRYVTKLDGQGNFVFKNLPPSTFYLYALKDEGGARRYFSEKQLFAFADSAINMSVENQPVTLYAYSAAPPAPVTTAPSSLSLGRGRPSNERLRYQTTLLAGQQDLLSDFTLVSEQPLKFLDTAKVRVTMDSIHAPVTGYSIILDSSRRKMVLSNNWNENTLYHLLLEKDFAEDSLGRRLLKTDTISFTTKRLADYGSLELKIRNIELERNPVLLFVLNNQVARSFPLTSGDFAQAVFLPGDYELRILYDENRNGKWDPGEFFGKRKQPERVVPIRRVITVKPDFENEFEVSL